MSERVNETPKETHLKSGISSKEHSGSVFPSLLFLRILLSTPQLRIGQGTERQSIEVFCCLHSMKGTQPLTESESPSCEISAQRNVNMFKN